MSKETSLNTNEDFVVTYHLLPFVRSNCEFLPNFRYFRDGSTVISIELSAEVLYLTSSMKDIPLIRRKMQDRLFLTNCHLLRFGRGRRRYSDGFKFISFIIFFCSFFVFRFCFVHIFVNVCMGLMLKMNCYA